MLQRNNVRMTVDFPAALHTYIKMAAAQEGISMRSYIINSLVHQMEDDNIDLDTKSFRKELLKMSKEDADLMKDLSDK